METMSSHLGSSASIGGKAVPFGPYLRRKRFAQDV